MLAAFAAAAGYDCCCRWGGGGGVTLVLGLDWGVWVVVLRGGGGGGGCFDRAATSAGRPCPGDCLFRPGR